MRAARAGWAVLGGAAALCLAAGGCGGDPSASMHHSRTSVLWLTLCTLRADHLGAYGYDYPVSPGIDALAREGVLFERTLTAAPWTRASIAASCTGLYPRSLNIEEPAAGVNNRKLHDSFVTLAETLREEGFFTIGITANPNTNAVFNFGQGFDHYEDTGDTLWRSGYGKKKRTAEDVNARFLDVLRGAAKDRKFFAHLTYVDVHTPLLDQAVAGRFPELAAALRNNLTARYDLQIRYLDEAIFKLVADLRAMGREDTLVIITSDHGEAFGDLHAGDAEHGRHLYNATIWVPLVFHHPALQDVAGRRKERVDLAGLMPTVLDLLGIEHAAPAGGAPSLKDLVLVPDAGEPRPDKPGVVETCFKDVNRSALVWSGWKLIATYPSGSERQGEPHALRRELYRLDADWAEARDLSADMPDEVNKLARELARWQEARAPRVGGDGLDVAVPGDTIEDLKALGYVK